MHDDEAEFGLRLPPWKDVQPKDFTNLLKKIRDRPDAALLETVLLRSQSMAVYAKSGLSGRSELAAFFLEDLLVPRQNPDPAASTVPQPPRLG